MATQTDRASDHSATTVTDEQVEKVVKEVEANEEKSDSLSKGNEEKGEKVVEAPCTTIPLANSGEEEGEKAEQQTKAEVEESKDIPAMEVPVAGPDAVQRQPKNHQPIESTIEDTSKEPAKDPTEAREEPKTANVPESAKDTIEKPSEHVEVSHLKGSGAMVVKESEISKAGLKKEEEKPIEPEMEDKEKDEEEQPNPVCAPDSSAETKEKPREPEKEDAGKGEEDQPKPAYIPDLSAESIEKQKESETEDIVKGEEEHTAPVSIPHSSAETKEISRKTEKEDVKEGKQEQQKTVSVPDPSAETTEKSREPEKEDVKKGEQEQSKEIFVSESSPDSIEKPSETVEVRSLTELDAKVTKASENSESDFTKAEEIPGESEKEPIQKEEQEHTKEAGNPSEPIEVSTLAKSDTDVGKEAGNSEESTKDEKPEPVVCTVKEQTEEQEKVLTEKAEDEQPKTVHAPELSAGAIEKPNDPIEVNPFPKSDAKAMNKINENIKAERAEVTLTEMEETPKEEKDFPEKGQGEQQKTVSIPETSSENIEKQNEPVPISHLRESDAEVVKEAISLEVNPEPVVTEVEEKPRELAENIDNVDGQRRKEKIQGSLVNEISKDKEPMVHKIEDTKQLKEEQRPITDEHETVVLESSEQVQMNQEAQPNVTNGMESSPAFADKNSSKDEKKEASDINVVEESPKELTENPKQALDNQETEAGTKDGEQKVIATDNKATSRQDPVEALSRDMELENKESGEENESKTVRTEVFEGVSVKTEELVNEERPASEINRDDKVERQLDEVTPAANVACRETLESKFKEESVKSDKENLKKEDDIVKAGVQNQEPPTKFSDNGKPSEDLPKEVTVKATQKHSNNIISKMKQSLVKAKKAITGKSPSSKTISSEAK